MCFTTALTTTSFCTPNSTACSGFAFANDQDPSPLPFLTRYSIDPEKSCRNRNAYGGTHLRLWEARSLPLSSQSKLKSRPFQAGNLRRLTSPRVHPIRHPLRSSEAPSTPLATPPNEPLQVTQGSGSHVNSKCGLFSRLSVGPVD